MQYRGKTYRRTAKTDQLDIVTEADIASNELILRSIKNKYPGHGILSEETIPQNTESPYCWIIDPLDGTKEFTRGLPLFSVNIALSHKDKLVAGAVYLPVLGELFMTHSGGGAHLNDKRLSVSGARNLAESLVLSRMPVQRGNFTDEWNTLERITRRAYRTRIYGHDILGLTWVASGAYDGYYSPPFPKWWDIAPGILMVAEAGGSVSTMQGNELTKSSYLSEGICASNGKIHSEMLETLRGGIK